MAKYSVRINNRIVDVVSCWGRPDSERRMMSLVRFLDPFQTLGKPCHL